MCLVAQIRFVEWTAEGRLRHAAFLGLRSDKSAREVRRKWSGLSGGSAHADVVWVTRVGT